jgi:Protein of unknown function (DUF4012)
MDGEQGLGGSARSEWPQAAGRESPRAGGLVDAAVDDAPTMPLSRVSSADRADRRMPRIPAPPLRRPRTSRRLKIAALVALALLLVLGIPGVLAISTGLRDYNELKALGLSGVRHLLHAAAILEGKDTSSAGSGSSCAAPSAGASPTAAGGASTLLSHGIPTVDETRAAGAELQAAQGDFATLKARIDRPDWVLSDAQVVPGVSGKLTTARGLAYAGWDVATMGAELLGAAQPVVGRLHGGSLGAQALVTQQDLDGLQHAADDSVKLLADVRTQLAHVNLDDLPVCAAQKAEFRQLAGALPQAQDLLQQADGLIQPVGWLFGLDQPRHLLVQELDRTELRPTGGFTGQYGILTISGGKVEPFSLLGANELDYVPKDNGGLSNGWSAGRRPPAPYSWWPIPNWGLRDGNLSADFPSDAKLVMYAFKNEATDPYFKDLGGGNVDGVVNFSPVAIEHFLAITGPMTIDPYGETVTAANLEQRIHYYQYDPNGLAKSRALFGDPDDFAARHRFAQQVASQLTDRAKHLPTAQLLDVAKQALKDMQARDIQVYLTNQALEDELLRHGLGGAMQTQAGVDSYFLVHTNYASGKINDHLKVSQQDEVTLDDKGGATHHLTVVMDNYWSDTIIPHDHTTYWDYVRLYLPTSAHLLGSNGFQTGAELCRSSECPSNPYPGWLSCPGVGFHAEQRTTTLAGEAVDKDPPLTVLGGLGSIPSEVQDRAAWGGSVVVPVNCSMKLTIDWYTPDVAAPSHVVPAGATPYTDLVERQGATFYGVTVRIQPSPSLAARGFKPATFSDTLDTDLKFTLGAKGPQRPTVAFP